MSRDVRKKTTQKNITVPAVTLAVGRPGGAGGGVIQRGVQGGRGGSFREGSMA